MVRFLIKPTLDIGVWQSLYKEMQHTNGHTQDMNLMAYEQYVSEEIWQN